MQIEEVAGSVVIGATTFHDSDVLTLDGNNGSVYAGAAQTELHCPDDLLERLKVLRQGADAATAPAHCVR